MTTLVLPFDLSVFSSLVLSFQYQGITAQGHQLFWGLSLSLSFAVIALFQTS